MTIRNLDKLLAPASVVLVGASPKPASVGNIVARNLLQGGFSGPIWFVNPRHAEVEGVRCYASVRDLPGTPDLAVIATPPATIPALIRELGEKGTRAVVVISAGITGELRKQMLEAARPFCLRIEGPNCIGLILPRVGLNASFCHRMPEAGDLAFLSQSGALITAIVDWASNRGVGFSHVVSLGDMADADFGDFLDYLAGDQHSRAILLYMEQLTHAPKFMSAARRAARAKPVIVLKTGRHEMAAKAAMSHTGALAGSDAAYNAVFRRSGLLRVLELEELLEAAEILSTSPRFVGDRLAIVTNGGGAGVLAADTLADLNGRLAELSAKTTEKLDAELPATWSRGNPVDIIGDAGADRYDAAMRAVLADPEADAVLVMNCPTALASSDEAARVVIDAVDSHRRAAAGRAGNKPVLANWLGDGAARKSREMFVAADIPNFATPSAAVRGFMQLVRYNRAQEELMRTPPSLPDLRFDRQRVDDIIANTLRSGRTTLSEIEAKDLLAAYGIPVVPTVIARTPEEAKRAAEEICRDESAVVIKILSDDITHKSDVGGVRLGLKSANEAREAAESMLASVRQRMPDARITGFTVQPMIVRPRAYELIVGMSVDRTVGPLMMFGAGGTAVEVMADTAHALPPLDLRLAQAMMGETRINRLLEGFRDRPAAHREAVATVLVQVSYLIANHPEIRELDINPLIADEHGCIALDARVRVADEAAHPRVPMAIRPYPVEWEAQTDVDGVGAVKLRPVRPEDEVLYDRFFASVTAEDMRMRFFTAGPNLSHQLLARLTQIDYGREMAFGAIAQTSGALLGVARLIADPDYRRAEFAVLVRSDLKGRGLGWRLMQHLIAYARAEGLGELHGQVLATNLTMLAMCDRLGFSVTADDTDAGLRHARLVLSDA